MAILQDFCGFIGPSSIFWFPVMLLDGWDWDSGCEITVNIIFYWILNIFVRLLFFLIFFYFNTGVISFVCDLSGFICLQENCVCHFLKEFIMFFVIVIGCSAPGSEYFTLFSFYNYLHLQF